MVEFSLPDKGTTASEWGDRLAWSYMQLNWTETAERERITPLTEPEIVHKFITSSPGLLETCELLLDLALEYAPQLTIPGFEGPLITAIEDAFHTPLSAAAPGKKTCAVEWALRLPDFGGYDSYSVASEYFYGGFAGPRVNPYELADNLFWLLSDSSLWLPSHIRSFLTNGVAAHPALPWSTYGLDRGDWADCGALNDAISAAVKRKRKFVWSKKMKSDLRARVEKSFTELNLRGDIGTVVDAYIDRQLAGVNVEKQREFKSRRK
jgi:hypothetical protein